MPPDHAPALNNGDNNSAVAVAAAAAAAVATEAMVPDAAPSNSIVAATNNNRDSVNPPTNYNDMIQHHTSKVNGLGMWSAWERNFTNKVKACLDLVDNAVDAALWDSDDEEEEDEEDDDDADADADGDANADDDNKKSEEEDKNKSNKKVPLTREEKWKKHTGNIEITTERHRLAMASAAAAGEACSDDSAEDDSPPVIIHELAGNGSSNSNSDNNDIDDYDYILDDDNTLCLHNDCVRPVKELKSILDVYNSSKTDSAIGENGVGVKQAAAAMSDLSIVVTTRIDQEPLLEKIENDDSGDNDDHNIRTNGNNATDKKDPSIRKCVVSIGVLSKELQTNEAIVIPNWTIEVEFRVDDEQQKKKGDNKNGVDFSGDDCFSVLMNEIATVTAKYPHMGKAMKQFGVAVKKNQRMHGIRRLAKHVEIMISSKYSKSKKGKKNQQQQQLKPPPHPYQFLMILHRFGKHQIKKSNENKNNNDQSDDVAIKAKNALDDLLRDLAEELPKTYLHIPPAPYFKIKVNSEALKFQYWERQVRYTYYEYILSIVSYDRDFNLELK